MELESTHVPIAVVVEDDQEQRHLIVALLEETDLQIIDVDGAEQALGYLRQGADRVALVFTDISPPCLMDGAGLACAVQANWPWITILVVSENRLGDLPSSARYMAKPWRALDVLVQADRASKRHRDYRQGIAA
jgi:DNA-binding NtrC family response regulator